MKTREDALSLLHEYTRSESLLVHARCVEAAMLWYANYFSLGEAETLCWGITGLLHDFDYEQFPEPQEGGHPYKGNRILTELGYSEDIREAIMGHADYTGVPRESLMAKALFAVDELSGFIVACTLVRPERSLKGLEVRSVKKKLKTRSFAQGCNREDIALGATELGIELDQHIANVINALQEIASEINL